MLGDALGYPARGEDALTTILVGGLLPILATLLGVVGLTLSVVLVGLLLLPVALLPILALFGYYVAVLRGVIAGDPDPPRFRNWKRLLADGGRFVVVSLVCAVPFVFLTGTFVAVLAASEVTVGDPTAETVIAVGAAVVGLLAAGALLVYAYVQPLALALLAREGHLRAAFDFATLRQAGLSKAYVVAWLLAVLVWMVVSALEGALWIVVVGFFVGFYGDVVRYYLYGRGVRRSLDGPDDDEPTPAVDSEHERERERAAESLVPGTDHATGSLDGKTIPRVEEPRTFAVRTGKLDDERGWSDWETDGR